MGSHEKTRNGESNVWLTPPSILYCLGPFDLDPCAAPEPRPWATAKHHVTLPDDGLRSEWFGRVWCNPPYGEEAERWLEKMAAHGRGTALVFARTETRMWRDFVWPAATAVRFLFGRLSFFLPDGTRARKSNAGAPSVLIAYGQNDADQLATCGIAGYFVRLRDAGSQQS
jgi:hypothetical protein